MRAPSSIHLPQLMRSEELISWAGRLVTSIGAAYVSIISAINGALTFGDGTSKGNIRGQWVQYISHATPGTETAVAHTLGVVPIGRIVFDQDKAGSAYKGSTAWTSTTVYLKSDVATVTFKLWLQAP